MWPFGPSPITGNDLKRVDLLEEKVESMARRMASLLEDVEEFYFKVNKARQRVVKAESDAARAPGFADESREQQKARLRANMNRQARG